MLDQNNNLTNTPEVYAKRDLSAEAAERFNPDLVRTSQEHMRSWSKEKLQALKEEGEQIAQELAAVMQLGIESPAVQNLIKRHHALIENYYHVTKEIYQGLGDLYGLDEEFAAFYEKYAIGLADFIRHAIGYYTSHEFKEIKSQQSV